MRRQLRFKDDIQPFINTNGFWYSLFEGGDLRPSDYVYASTALNNINKAIATLKNFQQEMEAQGLIEEA